MLIFLLIITFKPNTLTNRQYLINFNTFSILNRPNQTPIIEINRDRVINRQTNPIRAEIAIPCMEDRTNQFFRSFVFEKHVNPISFAIHIIFDIRHLLGLAANCSHIKHTFIIIVTTHFKNFLIANYISLVVIVT